MAALANYLYIGDIDSPAYTFDNDSIIKARGIFSVDVIGNELAYDQAEITVYYIGSGLQGIEYGTPASWINDGTTMGDMYVSRVERVGRFAYRITLISAIGLLDNINHAGGVYNGETFGVILNDILLGALGPVYYMSAAVAKVQIYGWLPYATARENLHQLMFATGASIRRMASGQMRFVFLDSGSPISIPDDRISIEGDVDYTTPASAAEITEHAYFSDPSDEVVTLFDNSSVGDNANNTLVIFSEGVPIHDLAVTGTLTIDESGVNYAAVSGVGTLTGKRYTHNTRIVSLNASPSPPVENIKRVTDMTLVSMANSLNVARRVLAYYTSAKTVRAKIIIEGEKPGDVLAMHDPFMDSMTAAFLADMDVNASSNLLGTCKLIDGYKPTGQGNNVNGLATLTGSGSWTVPAGVTEITAVLIGGGSGGKAGGAGGAAATPIIVRDGRRMVYYKADSIGPGGTGGLAGDAGSAGKVLVLSGVAVTPGASIAYSCGAGGSGEVFGGAAATAGGNTTFGANSSATGSIISGGYINPISGTRLATAGDPGVAGGAGMGIVQNPDEPLIWDETPQATVNYLGETYYSGQRGGNREADDGDDLYVNAHGGFGGGPAAGSNGGNGTTPSGGFYTLYAGAGGDGADAVTPAKPSVYGKGGAGGNGGGGAGAYGYPSIIGDYSSVELQNIVTPTAGTPGNGSDGGDGGDGCVIIYY